MVDIIEYYYAFVVGNMMVWLGKAKYNNNTNKQSKQKEKSVDNGKYIRPIILSSTLQPSLFQFIHQSLQGTAVLTKAVHLMEKSCTSI